MTDLEKYSELANGKKAPRVCVDALDLFENEWPGATFPYARTAIAVRVIEAYEKFKQEEEKEKQ